MKILKECKTLGSDQMFFFSIYYYRKKEIKFSIQTLENRERKLNHNICSSRDRLGNLFLSRKK